MKFHPLEIPGAYRIDIEPHVDERGAFARTWCHREAKSVGIEVEWVQCNLSRNEHAGTLRGMHYQDAPHREDKLVRCTKGAIYDVLLDLRRESPAFGKWVSVELSEDNQRQTFIPKGVAHGFQSLSKNSDVFYMMSEYYHPEFSRGIRWDDPTLSIPWPLANPRTSPRDGDFPLFHEIA